MEKRHFASCAASRWLLNAISQAEGILLLAGENYFHPRISELTVQHAFSNAGDVFCFLISLLRGTSNCGVTNPQHKMRPYICQEMALGMASGLPFQRKFAVLNNLLRGFLRENPGAKK